jgi:hypothetical protein
LLHSGGVAYFQDKANQLTTVSRMPIDVFFLEGCQLQNYNPPDMRSKNAPNVSVVLGNDLNFIDAGNQDFVGFCAVGTVLGVSTNKQIHESFAWVGGQNGNNNLTDASTGNFLNAAILGLADINTMQAFNFVKLSDNGYIFPRFFANFSGIYWAQSNNCVAETVDIHNNETQQVVNKLRRILYETAVPYINQIVSVDSNGRLMPNENANIKNVFRNAIEANLGTNISELSSLIIDPAKDENNVPYPSFLSDKTLRVIAAVRPKGKIEQIFITIFLTNN